MSVLITGCAGFIGSHVCEALVKAYPERSFVGLDKLDECASLQNLTPIEHAPNFHMIVGDICDSARVQKVFRRHAIHTVLHFAAESHVDNSFGNSLSFTRNNVLGTHTLLEAARKQPEFRLFLHVSTDEVYGTRDGAQHEQAVLDPTNPYAASKAAAEQLVRAYHHSYGLPVIITRSNNVYGPRQFPEKLIPKFLLLLRRGKPCCVHGDGRQLRSFVHVQDIVRAFEMIWLRGRVGETYNIGTEFEISVLAIAQRLVQMLKRLPEALNAMPSVPIVHVRDRPFNDLRYRINSDKLKALGWRPEIHFESGLADTVQWYLDTDIQQHWPWFSEDTLAAHPSA